MLDCGRDLDPAFGSRVFTSLLGRRNESGALNVDQHSDFSFLNSVRAESIVCFVGRDDYEAELCDVAEKAEEGDMGFFLSHNVAGKGGPLPEDEEEEEWERLDRLSEEATRQPAVMKQREPPKAAVAASQASAAGAAAGPRVAPNSKTSLVQTIMADKTLSPAERQLKVNLRSSCACARAAAACVCSPSPPQRD